MIVNINQDWRLRSDEVQWILDRRVQSRKGTGKPKTVWKVAGFSRHLNCVIMELAWQEIRLIKGEYPPTFRSVSRNSRPPFQAAQPVYLFDYLTGRISVRAVHQHSAPFQRRNLPASENALTGLS